MDHAKAQREAAGEPPSIEELTLVALGYGHCLDTAVIEGSDILGRNFLDAYGESPHRQTTADIMHAFNSMGPDDPDYAAARAYIQRFLVVQFGPPIIESGPS